MSEMIFFPFSVYWSFYLFFILFVLGVLALDLGVFHKNAHEVSFKEASAWTAIWISLACIFNLFFYYYTKWNLASNHVYSSIPDFNPKEIAKGLSLEFFTGFIVEKSLAIDNIFIFAVVFRYFGIPKIYQHRVLFWGIIGALLFRGIFIALGSILMQYKFIVLFFGVLLIITGIKMFFIGTKHEDLENNFIVKQLKRIFRIYPKIEGQKFFLKKDSFIYVTPLFLALVFIEITDIIFAIDSVPAIFALTNEPLIVFTSNIFAILGLRSMYFMLSGVMDKFIYIKYGLAGVLVFVGTKMVYLNEAFGGKFPISWSLSIISVLIGSSIIASIIIDKRHQK